MLEKNPDNRIKAQDILNNEWVTKNGQDINKNKFEN